MTENRSQTSRHGAAKKSTAGIASDSARQFDADDLAGNRATGAGGFTPVEHEPEVSKPQGFAAQFREKATSEMATQKDRLTEGLNSTVEAVRHTTEQLRRQDQSTIADYLERGVDQVEHWVERFRQRDVGQMVRDVQDFGRRQPALLLAGSFAVGVVAARFLKSSANSGEPGGFGTPGKFREE